MDNYAMFIFKTLPMVVSFTSIENWIKNEKNVYAYQRNRKMEERCRKWEIAQYVDINMCI